MFRDDLSPSAQSWHPLPKKRKKETEPKPRPVAYGTSNYTGDPRNQRISDFGYRGHGPSFEWDRVDSEYKDVFRGLRMSKQYSQQIKCRTFFNLNFSYLSLALASPTFYFKLEDTANARKISVDPWTGKSGISLSFTLSVRELSGYIPSTVLWSNFQADTTRISFSVTVSSILVITRQYSSFTHYSSILWRNFNFWF